MGSYGEFMAPTCDTDPEVLLDESMELLPLDLRLESWLNG